MCPETGQTARRDDSDLVLIGQVPSVRVSHRAKVKE
jgi:hypothetical protein